MSILNIDQNSNHPFEFLHLSISYSFHSVLNFKTKTSNSFTKLCWHLRLKAYIAVQVCFSWSESARSGMEARKTVCLLPAIEYNRNKGRKPSWNVQILEKHTWSLYFYYSDIEISYDFLEPMLFLGHFRMCKN